MRGAVSLASDNSTPSYQILFLEHHRSIVLESEYSNGTDRDYTMVGGYSIVLENKDDLAEFKRIINYEEHPCEWAVRESRGCEYINALYIINDDFSIMVYMPIFIAPTAILNELED